MVPAGEVDADDDDGASEEDDEDDDDDEDDGGDAGHAGDTDRASGDADFVTIDAQAKCLALGASSC